MFDVRMMIDILIGGPLSCGINRLRAKGLLVADPNLEDSIATVPMDAKSRC